MRSKDWQPAWVVERRVPVFMGGEGAKEEADCAQRGDLGVGTTIWGNTPAMDVVNLPANENDASADLAIAFPASGDLRHVVKTINSLPEDYSGKLTILLNDATMFVVCRNFITLAILGTIEDRRLAADIALHYWYSLLIPVDYKRQIEAATNKFLDHCADYLAPQPPFALGQCSDISMPIIPEPPTADYLRYCGRGVMKPEAVKAEYERMRNLPSRRDYFARMYYNLQPSHRVAFQEYRRSGIVLPFGANQAAFTEPNASLFMTCGCWLQTDLADPLYGWDIQEVVASGKAHGAHSEDIYGCLYFHVTDQLLALHQRMRKFRISFKVTPVEATILACTLRDGRLSGYGLPPTTRFDRIMVSNIFDECYVGLTRVLESWQPLLARKRCAAIVGYFMNWFTLQPGSHPEGRELEAILRRLREQCNLTDGPALTFKDKNDQFSMEDGTLILYDNSKAFAAYLKKQGLDRVLSRTGLKLRAKHTITPHRYCAPLGAPSSALPRFADDQTQYLYARATSATWGERFVEFSRK